MLIKAKTRYIDIILDRVVEKDEIVAVERQRGQTLISKKFAELYDEKRIPIFLSYPQPHMKNQVDFIQSQLRCSCFERWEC